MNGPTRQPCCLTIAGSDSGGGAGIQADLKTFAAHDCYGASVLTALTAQNTLGVQGVHNVDPDFVKAQYESVMSDIQVDCIKFGMLATKQTIATLAALVKRDARRLKIPLVLDPVCVSTSGHRLLEEDALDALRDDLMPLALVVTPNVPEAEVLSGVSIRTIDDMVKAAAKIAGGGIAWVYVKGGHLPQVDGSSDGQSSSGYVVDVLYNGIAQSTTFSRRPLIRSKNTHGTGCSLASAIAANLAKGLAVPEAVKNGADYVSDAMHASRPLGAGAGPIEHFHCLTRRAIALPTPNRPHPFTDALINYSSHTWHRYLYHPFPIALANGTAPLGAFLHFIKQDYHFLKQYGRTNALAGFKTENMEEMKASMDIVATVCRETEMHVGYCEQYGISREELINTPESIEGTAYSRFVLDTSMRGDLLDGRVVTAACLVGYGHVGKRLCFETSDDQVDKTENNPYWKWVAEYGSDWYQQAVDTGIALLEQTVQNDPISPKRLKELCEIFKRATELEIAFWDGAMNAGEN